MSNAAKSVYYFGFWFVMGGLGLLLLPNLVLPLLGLSPTNDLFVRLLGMVMLILAYYYIRAARRELTDFFYWTVPARVSGFIFFVVLVLLDIGPPILIALGVIDVLAALWTRQAIRSQEARSASDKKTL
jgi:uncharacterized membrane protein